MSSHSLNACFSHAHRAPFQTCFGAHADAHRRYSVFIQQPSYPIAPELDSSSFEVVQLVNASCTAYSGAHSDNTKCAQAHIAAARGGEAGADAGGRGHQ